jgi:hypothetical protein
MAMKAKAPRTQQGFTSVDDFLAEEGMLEKFEALAKSEVLEWQAKGGAKVGKNVGGAATRAAIAELEAGEGRHFGSVEALMADLHSER